MNIFLNVVASFCSISFELGRQKTDKILALFFRVYGRPVFLDAEIYFFLSAHQMRFGPVRFSTALRVLGGRCGWQFCILSMARRVASLEFQLKDPEKLASLLCVCKQDLRKWPSRKLEGGMVSRYTRTKPTYK